MSFVSRRVSGLLAYQRRARMLRRPDDEGADDLDRGSTAPTGSSSDASPGQLEGRRQQQRRRADDTGGSGSQGSASGTTGTAGDDDTGASERDGLFLPPNSPGPSMWVDFPGSRRRVGTTAGIGVRHGSNDKAGEPLRGQRRLPRHRDLPARRRPLQLRQPAVHGRSRRWRHVRRQRRRRRASGRLDLRPARRATATSAREQVPGHTLDMRSIVPWPAR